MGCRLLIECGEEGLFIAREECNSLGIIIGEFVCWRIHMTCDMESVGSGEEGNTGLGSKRIWGNGLCGDKSRRFDKLDGRVVEKVGSWVVGGLEKGTLGEANDVFPCTYTQGDMSYKEIGDEKIDKWIVEGCDMFALVWGPFIWTKW